MIYLQYILGIGLMLFGIYVIGVNYGCIIVSECNKRKRIDKHHSVSPLIVPMSHLIGTSLSPFKIGVHVLIVLVLDPGTWPIVLGLPYALLTQLLGLPNKKNDRTT
jgi:hypothetical protein